MIRLEYLGRNLQYTIFLLLNSMIWRYSKYLANLVFSGSAVSYVACFLSSVCLCLEVETSNWRKRWP